MLTDKQRAQTALRQRRFRERQEQARRQELAAKGLPALPAIPTIPAYPRWRRAMQAAQALITQVHEEMAAYYEERSDAWQEGKSGVQFAELQGNVETLLNQFDEVLI